MTINHLAKDDSVELVRQVRTEARDWFRGFIVKSEVTVVTYPTAVALRRDLLSCLSGASPAARESCGRLMGAVVFSLPINVSKWPLK